MDRLGDMEKFHSNLRATIKSIIYRVDMQKYGTKLYEAKDLFCMHEHYETKKKIHYETVVLEKLQYIFDEENRLIQHVFIADFDEETKHELEIMKNDEKIPFSPNDYSEEEKINVTDLFKTIFKGGMPELYDIPNMKRELFLMDM